MGAIFQKKDQNCLIGSAYKDWILYSRWCGWIQMKLFPFFSQTICKKIKGVTCWKKIIYLQIIVVKIGLWEYTWNIFNLNRF